MSGRRPLSERLPRWGGVLLVAVLLFVWVFLYRFNTLGGAFAGFDNDHFLYFATAKQVQAGEQPLRDFQDAMHGAWPSLTYELSAAAQRHFGDNLRSEAWLTVGGVALGAAIAFVAASVVAPWPWALATAWLTALLAPKLYGYPKVVVTAVAALLIVGSSGLPTWRRVAVMSLWTAVAFLFRHDYAVYCAIGFTALMALAGAAPWRQRLERAGGYVLLTALLLGPSLVWVQRYAGLVEYVRNGLEMSQHEYERTEIGWPALSRQGVPSLSALFDQDDNAEAWIYYLYVALPLLVTAIAAWRLRRGVAPDDRAAALLALGLMTLALWSSFLRGNLAGRFGEMGAPIAVIGAWLLSRAIGRGRPSARTVLTASAAVVVLAVTVVCTWRLASVASELRNARLLEPFDLIDRTKRASAELVEMPRSLRESQAADAMQAADYLHRCTRPTDRVIAVGYYPDVPAISERRFAGGRVTWVAGFYADDRYMREAVARIESQSVPIVLGGKEIDDPPLHRLAEYVRANYDEAGVVAINQGSLRVWVRRGAAGTPSGPKGLPCFG